MKRRFFLGIVMIAILGAFIISFLLFGVLNKEESPKKRINIGVSSSESSFLLYLSKELDLFSNNGLEVVFQKSDSGVEAMKALIDDKVDVSTASEFVAVSYIGENPDLRIIGTIDFPRLIHLIVKEETLDNGRINLDNLKIGLKHKSLCEYLIQKYIILNEIPHKNTEYIDMNPDEMLSELKKGSVDGVVIWHPHVYRIVEEFQDSVETVNIQSEGLSYFLLVTKENKLSEKRAIPLLRSLKEAEKFLYSDDTDNKNETEAKKILMNTYDYKEQYAEIALKENDYRVTLPQTLLITMESERKWLVENDVEGIEDGDYNYLNNIEEKYLKAVDSNSVSIY